MRKGQAGVVICTRHPGKDVEDVRRKETNKGANMGGVGRWGVEQREVYSIN